jgi:dihydroflavonol-4-reductase
MVKKYLVTGASGFIAMHVVNQLLKEGQSVRGTIRSLNDKEKVDALKKIGPVELVEANLDDTESWKRAVKGVDVVIHVATPTTTSFTMGESETIKQAVNGKKNSL